MSDEFGKRMKEYEGVEAKRRFMPLLPICARIDGRGFSRFTRGFEKPFDSRLGTAMNETTKLLIEKTHAKIGYTQSDEISLIWEQESYDSQIWFDGRIQKMCSVLAGMASTAFLKNLMTELGASDQKTILDRLPHFDCRIWQVPNRMEASNVLLWRAMDAKKNAVSSACRAHFSAKQMHGKNQEQMKQMLLEAGIDFDNEYNASDRYGDFFQRQTHMDWLDFDEETWNKIPEKHRASMPAQTERSTVVALGLGYFGDITNRVEVIFDQDQPLYRESFAA